MPAETSVSAITATPVKTPASRQQRTAQDPVRQDFWGDSPPQTLAAFREWWMTAPALGNGSYPRVAPRGNANAKLMVLVPDPEPADTDQLLSGPQGRLLSAILDAMGLAPSECYIAAALPRHTPMADLAAFAASGLDSVTAHHITLAAPQRLVVFGQALNAFLPAFAASEEHGLRQVNHAEANPPVMITETLGSMLDMPRLKARFWRRWMEFSE